MMANRNIFSCFPRLRLRNPFQRARRQIPDAVEQKVDHLPEIRDGPKGDTSSQTENAKLSALQKKLEIELKVKHGAENMIKAYSNDPPKNAKHLAAVRKKLKGSEKKIARLRSRIQSLIKEQPSLPAPETDINTAAPSMLVTERQEPEPAGDFPILPSKPITLPDVEHDFETPSQTFLDDIQHEISAYVKIQNILAQRARRQIPDAVEQKVDQLPESPETQDFLQPVSRSSASDSFSTVDLTSSTSDISLESTEISDAPTSDTSSQADNVKLSALQKKLEIELKVKQGADNLIKAYSNDPPKNVHHIAAVLEKRQDSENKIVRLRSRIQALIKEQPSLPAPETDINTAAPSMLVMDTQEPEPAGDFQLFSMKPIVPPDVELHLDAAPAPSQTFLYSILREISIYIEFPDFLAQDFGEGHEYTSDSKEMITNPTPDVRIRLRIPLTMEDFKLRSVLGRGSFGKVLLAKYKDTGNMYALKPVPKSAWSCPLMFPRSLLIEKRIFQAVTNRRHPFLINMFGSFHTQDHAVFVMEYAAGGDLKTHLKQGPFPEPRAVFYSACVVLGLEFLHQQKIVHRDLKLENIVLDEKGFAKITDFGLCKEGIGYGDTTGSPSGTPHYAAPEVLKGAQYTRAVDWWSVGVVIYAMLSGKFPTSQLNEHSKTRSSNCSFKHSQSVCCVESQPVIVIKLRTSVHYLNRGGISGSAEVAYRGGPAKYAKSKPSPSETEPTGVDQRHLFGAPDEAGAWWDPGLLKHRIEPDTMGHEKVVFTRFVAGVSASGASISLTPNTSESAESIEESSYVRIRLRIPLTMEDFKLRSVLGRGSFGKVLLAKYKDTGNMYALKVIRKGDIESSSILDCLLIEKRVFQAVTNRRHPFLINMFGSFHTQDHAVFVMEYAAGGDLKTHLKQGPFPEPRAVFYSACVVLGLEFLHQQKIVHRDLKLENIVLDEKGFAKITDFGLCKEGIGYGDTTGTPWGTPLYAAPEVLKGKPYTRAVDWWSVGVVIYAMLSGKHIDWAALLLKNVTPPFVPTIDGPEDVSNFSCMFTLEYPKLTPTKRRTEIPCYEAEAFEDFNWRADWN
ncbi:Serine threonine- kinase N2 [Pelobates cultripes]|uniref:Serine threonine- kinase N2, partial n=1 Tax=Pelobates cultripes TaxID=61616 RepID=A0AAD1R978_PELCU|nr:Serine threonine- kinase N2 [Pelobates cultripes]